MIVLQNDECHNNNLCMYTHNLHTKFYYKVNTGEKKLDYTNQNHSTHSDQGLKKPLKKS